LSLGAITASCRTLPSMGASFGWRDLHLVRTFARRTLLQARLSQRTPHHASAAIAVKRTGAGWRMRERGDRV